MELYHPVRIGNLELEGNLFLAPIAGYSDCAFRSLCVEQGASYCTTEMVSAEALTRGSEKTQDLMEKAPNEKKYAVQIFGGNADVMSRSVELVLSRSECTSIDINGGCPVPKIVKAGAGSMLTREPERLYAIVSAVKKASVDYTEKHPERGEVPVTVKIRSGWDSAHLTWKEAAQAAIDAGADAITIHARTRAQGYEGKADWNIQRQLVDFVAGRIPVFLSFSTRGGGRKMLRSALPQLCLEEVLPGEHPARSKKENPYPDNSPASSSISSRSPSSVSVCDVQASSPYSFPAVSTSSGRSVPSSSQPPSKTSGLTGTSSE